MSVPSDEQVRAVARVLHDLTEPCLTPDCVGTVHAAAARMLLTCWLENPGRTYEALIDLQELVVPPSKEGS